MKSKCIKKLLVFIFKIDLIFHDMFETSAMNINNILLLIYFISKHFYFVIFYKKYIN